MKENWLNLLNAANGKRRIRTLGSSKVLELIKDLPEEGTLNWCNSGADVSSCYRQRAYTTLAVVATIDSRSYLGITVVNAKSQGRPSAGWEELRWWNSRTSETQRNQLRIWIKANLGKKVVEITPAVVVD